MPTQIPFKPLLLVGILISVPAQAQYLGLGFESNVALTRQDLDILRRTVNGEIHGHPVGATASWSNRESGNYGSVKLLKKYNSGGMHCEQLRYTIATSKRAVAAEHYTFNTCLQSDGSWKIS